MYHRKEGIRFVGTFPRGLSHFMLKALKTDGSSNLPKSIRAANKVSDFFKKYTINLSAFGFGAGVGSTQVLSPSSGVQDELYGELLKIWQQVKKNVAAIVFMLDESKHLQSVDGSWSFLRSVFTRLQENDARYMLLISGKPDFLVYAKDLFSPIERFLTRLEVGPMVPKETQEALEKPLHSYGRTIDSEAVKEIHDISNGHPYVIQSFGYCLFQEGKKHIDSALISKTMPRIMMHLSNQLFKDRFNAATSDEREVLLALSEIGGKVSPKDIVEKYPSLGGKNISKLLTRLTEKDCVGKSGRGGYSVFLPLFGEYVKANMSNNDDDELL